MLDVCAATPHGAWCLLVTSVHLETDLAACDIGDSVLTAVLGWAWQKMTRSTGGHPTDPMIRRCRELIPPAQPPGHTEVGVGGVCSAHLDGPCSVPLLLVFYKQLFFFF